MANAFTRRMFAITLRLLPRMFLGAVIGITVVAVYTSLAFMGEVDKRLYWIDHRDAIFTITIMRVFIGATIGFFWAIISKGRNKEGAREVYYAGPSTERKPHRES